MKDLFFDDNFYLIANPDVLKSNIDAKYHYKNFGKGEGRISSKRNCKKIIYNAKDSEKNVVFNFLTQKCHLSINIDAPIIKYRLPWRINNESFPNIIYEFQLNNLASSSKLDPNIFCFVKKMKLMCYFANYEI